MSTTYPHVAMHTKPQPATWSWARRETPLIFGIGLIANLAAAWWLVFVWQIGNRDALARTANAFYMLFSRDPHLASIGFVWPPLPSLLQLPLLPITHWLGHTTLAGPIVSSVFGAAALLVLNQVLIQLNTPCSLRWVLLALTQFNPGFWYLAASGLAEVILLVFLLATVWGYLLLPGQVRPAILAGLALALGFFVRYEALAMLPGIVAAIVAQRWFDGRRWQGATGAHLLTLLTPPVYALALWMFWNWQIMGDPLFFQRSEYSLSAAQDVARNIGAEHPLFAAWGGIQPTITYALTRLTQQNAAFVAAVIIVATLALAKRDGRLVGLVLLLLCVPAFTMLQVFLGMLAPWIRYWFYATPFAAVLIGALAGSSRSRWRFAALVPLTALFALAVPMCLVQMSDPTANHDEQRLSASVLDPAREPQLRAGDDYWVDIRDASVVAQAVDKHAQRGPVLIDSVLAYAIIMESRYPKQLVITNDSDFKAALGDPVAHVDSILILKPQNNGTPNAIEQQHPGLFADGKPWAKLDEDFVDTYRHWRLYSVAEAASQ